MSRQKAFKVLHFVSTGCFLICAAYLLVISMLQAGKSWLFILSVSGYSALLSFLLVSIYLFAVFRSATRNQKTEVEHPLTGSRYYSVFYDITPFVGMAGGLLSALGSGQLSTYAFNIAAGCFGATFVIWIVVDPLAGLLESFLPASRRHQRKRLAIAKAAKKKDRELRERMLAELNAEAELELGRWRQALRQRAEALASLAAQEDLDDREKESRAIDIGVEAWRLGGIACMNLLYLMTEEICRQTSKSPLSAESISLWWDGIGAWRSQLS